MAEPVASSGYLDFTKKFMGGEKKLKSAESRKMQEKRKNE